MSEEHNPWKKRFERERLARKNSERLLEEKSFELWQANQELEKQVQQRTESLKQALLETQKANRAKSDFLANMSNEIRTPLNGIIGFSKYLNDSNHLNNQDKKYASIIETSANSLLCIINDILDFSKIESGNFQISIDEGNIKKIAKETIELFSTKAREKEIILDLKIDDEIPDNINSDLLRLKQVISNLISNAIKFTNENGNVKVKLSLQNKDDSYCKIKVVVEDNGIGIPKDKLDSILNPFIQLENISNKQHTGTGLGLSICSNILKLMHSELQVESKENIGTSFSFELECSYNKNSEIEKVEKTSFVKESKKEFSEKILLAEDNLINQELMKAVLQSLKVQFEIVSNGKECLEEYCKNHKYYKLILMDINMPIMDGLDALKQIRAFEKKERIESINIIALTANAIKGDEEKYLNQGMNGYLSKPINTEKLKTILDKFLK